MYVTDPIAAGRRFLEEAGWDVLEHRASRGADQDFLCRSRHLRWEELALTVSFTGTQPEILRTSDESKAQICHIHASGSYRLVRNSQGLLRIHRRNQDEYGDAVWRDYELDSLYALVAGLGPNHPYFPESSSLEASLEAPRSTNDLLLLVAPGRPLCQEWGYELYIGAKRYPQRIRWSEAACRIFRVQENAIYGQIREDVAHLPEEERREAVLQAVLEVLLGRLQPAGQTTAAGQP